MKKLHWRRPYNYIETYPQAGTKKEKTPHEKGQQSKEGLNHTSNYSWLNRDKNVSHTEKQFFEARCKGKRSYNEAVWQPHDSGKRTEEVSEDEVEKETYLSASL